MFLVLRKNGVGCVQDDFARLKVIHSSVYTVVSRKHSKLARKRRDSLSR